MSIVVSTHFIEYPVNLCTWLFLNQATQFYFTQFSNALPVFCWQNLEITQLKLGNAA